MQNSVVGVKSTDFNKPIRKVETVTRNAAIAGSIGAFAIGTLSYGIQKDIINTSRTSFYGAHKLLKFKDFIKKNMFDKACDSLVSIQQKNNFLNKPASSLNNLLSNVFGNFSQSCFKAVEMLGKSKKVNRLAVAKPALVAGVVLAGVAALGSALQLHRKPASRI